MTSPKPSLAGKVLLSLGVWQSGTVLFKLSYGHHSPAKSPVNLHGKSRMTVNGKVDSAMVELVAAVVLLIVVALVACNCYLIYTAEEYNQRACSAVTTIVAKTIGETRDQRRFPAMLETVLSHFGQAGIFIDHPRLTYYKDNWERGVRTLIVTTSTFARVPAPFLIPDQEALWRGKVTVECTCAVQICEKKTDKKKLQGK